MERLAFLVRYTGSDYDTPTFLLTENTADCAAFLELRLCAATECREHTPVGPHAHVLESRFGRPQRYPDDDPERAGLWFRDYRSLTREVVIRWHLYHPGDDPPVVYFQQAKGVDA